MTLDELKNNKISTLNEFVNYISKQNRNTGISYLSDKITNIVFELVQNIRAKNAIVLNSNYGELSSTLKQIPSVVNLDVNKDKTEIAQYYNPDINFINQDPLTFDSSNKFDIVLSFPPLGLSINIDNKKNYSEILYVNKCLELLSENGTAIIIIANNFLNSSIYAETRDYILNNFGLSKIINLNKSNAFNRSIELSILEIKKNKTNKTDFFNVDSDFRANKIKPSIPINELNERWDFNFHNPENKSYQEEIGKYESKKIGDLVEVIIGAHFKKEECIKDGNYKIVKLKNIDNGEYKEYDDDSYIQKNFLNHKEGYAVLKKGDILIPLIVREKSEFYIHSYDDERLIASKYFAILRGKNAEYVALYLNTPSGLKVFNQQIERYKKGSVISTISISDIKEIQIPILPIEDLELASKNKLKTLEISEIEDIKKSLEKNSYDKNSQMYEMFIEMQSQLKEILVTVKDIQSNVSTLLEEFKAIKSYPREIEDKIIFMYKDIDEKLNNLSSKQKDIDECVIIIKKWFDQFDLLESNSKKYLPEAEFIYNQISNLSNPDYSPFVIQYCRALENELLCKIFRAYVQSLIDRKIDLEKEFVWDFQKKQNNKPNDEHTFPFVKILNKYIKENENEWHFELGRMEFILRKLGGESINNSPILKDFKLFVINKFNEGLFSIEYLNDIKSIITNYRNQSAHPNIIDAEKAMMFHKEIKECLTQLFDNYKNTKY